MTGGLPGRSAHVSLRQTPPFLGSVARLTPRSSWGSLKSQLQRHLFSLVTDTYALWCPFPSKGC